MPTSRAAPASTFDLPLELQARLLVFCTKAGEDPRDVMHDAVALALDKIAAPKGYTLRADLVAGVVASFLDDVESRAGEVAAS